MTTFLRLPASSVQPCDMGCAFAEALPMGDEEWRFCRRRGAPVREGVECPHYRGRGAGGEFVASGDEQAAEAAAGSRLR